VAALSVTDALAWASALPARLSEREATIARAAEHGVEAVAIGTPIDLARLIRIPIPSTRVSYGPPSMRWVSRRCMGAHAPAGAFE
jgi:hypothetical protein